MNTLVLKMAPFSLKKLLIDLRGLVKDEVRVKGLEFSLHLGKGVPDSLIGDPEKVFQVLVHLCTNAIAFTSTGEITVSVQLGEWNGEQVKLRFSVRDTGIGLTKKQAETLSESIFQGDFRGSRKNGKPEPGLVYCQKLVQLLGGNLGVESTLGKGCDFFFTALFETGARGASQSFLRKTLKKSDLLPLAGKRILVVDDRPDNLQVAGEVLKKGQMLAIFACNGREAVNLTRTGMYDAILMDLQMPVMDGFEATRQIRLLKGYAGVPIIAMTAHTMPTDRQRGMEVGIDEFLPKPFIAGDMYLTLLKWIKPPEAGDPSEILKKDPDS